MRQKTVITKLLQRVTEVYYKVHQVLQSVTEVYYKVRQVLQSGNAAAPRSMHLASTTNFF